VVGNLSGICGKLALAGLGPLPDSAIFPQSPAIIGASVRAGWRGGWQCQAIRHVSLPSPSGEMLKVKTLP